MWIYLQVLFVYRIFFFVVEFLFFWVMVFESVYCSYNYYSVILGFCFIVKVGLFGGVVFMVLDLIFFWFICLMLVVNVWVDYFGYEEEDVKGIYEGVIFVDYVLLISIYIIFKV